jgi:hypothetical protein
MPGIQTSQGEAQKNWLGAPFDPEPSIWPRPHMYLPGSQVSGTLYTPDGTQLGPGIFKVRTYAGSGFAGQVYCADVEADTGTMLGTAGPVALKFLLPTSQVKLWFRDILFLLSYQMTFAARLRAPAVRAGQLLNLVIRSAVVREGGAAGMVANPRGYTWDAVLRSYVEIYDWETGRPQQYTPDDQLLQRWLNPKAAQVHPVQSEMQRKHNFMDWLASLCVRLGAEGVARQYIWDTWISQANVLTCREEACADEFVAVDWRPGLAVPFFLPLSPAHARLIVRGLRRGRLVLFDDLDTAALRRYLGRMPDQPETLKNQDALLADTAWDQSSRPDLWQSADTVLREPDRRRAIQAALVADWQRLGRISTARARRLQHSRIRFGIHFVLSLLPFLGPWLQSMLDHPGYRRHLRDWVTQPAYRTPYLDELRRRDLAEWAYSGRLSQAQIKRLSESRGAYLAHKFGLSWMPATVHRLAADPLKRREILRRSFVLPVQLILNETARLVWLESVMQVQVNRGVLTEVEAAHALERVRTPRLHGFVRDLGLSVGLEVFSRVLYILLAFYGMAAGTFWPLLIAMLGPISPSGVIRFVYIGAQLLYEAPIIWRERKRKLLAARLSGLVIAPWRFVGNFCVPVEMFAYEPQISLMVAEYLVYQLVQLIPVFGGSNKLLEYTAFQLTFNLPLSLRRLILSGLRRPDLPRS